MTDGNERQQGTWKQFAWFVVRLLALLAMIFVFGLAVFKVTTHWTHH